MAIIKGNPQYIIFFAYNNGLVITYNWPYACYNKLIPALLINYQAKFGLYIPKCYISSNLILPIPPLDQNFICQYP